MSQSWNAHWAEDGFRPKRLGNWEVPRWHAQWPDMHCTTTKFQAHTNGRLFTSVKSTENPWSQFKGTWELPLKIDRKTAEDLSKATEIKKIIWDAHEAKNKKICQRAQCQAKCNKKIKSTDLDKGEKKKSEIDNESKTGNKDTSKAFSQKSSSSRLKSDDKCIIKEACLI